MTASHRCQAALAYGGATHAVQGGTARGRAVLERAEDACVRVIQLEPRRRRFGRRVELIFEEDRVYTPREGASAEAGAHCLGIVAGTAEPRAPL